MLLINTLEKSDTNIKYNIHENSKRVDHDKKVGDKVMLNNNAA